MNFQILTSICIFISNNEIIYEVQCNRHFIPCIWWGWGAKIGKLTDIILECSLIRKLYMKYNVIDILFHAVGATHQPDHPMI